MAASAIKDMKKEQEFHTRRGRRYEQPSYDGTPLYKPGDKLWVTERSLVYECEVVRVEKGQIHPATNKKVRIPEYVVKFIGHNPKTELKDTSVIEWDLFDQNNMPPGDVIYCGDHNRQMFANAKTSSLRKIIKKGLVFLSEEELASLEEARTKEKEKEDKKEKHDKRTADHSDKDKRKASESRATDKMKKEHTDKDKQKVSDSKDKEKSKRDAETYAKNERAPKRYDVNDQVEKKIPDRNRHQSAHSGSSAPDPAKPNGAGDRVVKDKKAAETKTKINPTKQSARRKDVAKPQPARPSPPRPTADKKPLPAAARKRGRPKANPKHKRLQQKAKRANIAAPTSKAITKISQRNKNAAKKLADLAKKRPVSASGNKGNSSQKRKRVA